MGLVSKANSPGSGLSDIPFFCFCYINVDVLEAFFMSNLLPQLTATTGNYAYVYLWIWVGEMSLWRPADDFVADLESLS
jgi:hypothetical protein